MRVFYFILLLLLPFGIYAQQKVTFLAEDGLKITADLYLKDYELPFILLFHQGESSRGEYNEIAARLLKLEYNCLAVDLRSGEKMNYIANETAARAKAENIPHAYLDAIKDIKAAILYVQKFNKKPVILFGSSYSASLCLVIAPNNKNVKAVVAFSPGEFFRPELIVKDKISGLDKPVFISSSDIEYEYIEQMFSEVPDSLKFIYRPPKGKGTHGAKALWKSSDSSDECWLELMLFFKKIRYE
jgi:pimeloyl-ACP methyl ester carboxylesterase